MIPLTAAGNRQVLVAFNRRALRSVAVVLANTGTTGPARLFRVSATVR